MSTNYEARINVCAHCERPDVVLHINKNLATFQGYRRRDLANVTHADSGSSVGDLLVAAVGGGDGDGDGDLDSWYKWKAVLCSDTFIVRVFDEYGTHHDTATFIAAVEAVVLTQRRRSYDWVMGHEFHNDELTSTLRADYHLDDDGFTFIYRDFT